jgi:threonine dehydratase
VDAGESVAQGRAATRLPSVETIAGGIEGGIGVETFEILRSHMDYVALVNDSEICAAMSCAMDMREKVSSRSGFRSQP